MNNEQKIAAMVEWLEANQPDVFRRGLWDAIAAPDASRAMLPVTDSQIANLYRETFNAAPGRVREAPSNVPPLVIAFGRAVLDRLASPVAGWVSVKAAKPIAWVVECAVDGEWVPQYPARFTKEQAEEDASMYGQTERRVTALIAAPVVAPTQQEQK